jgi:hypothetical protein
MALGKAASKLKNSFKDALADIRKLIENIKAIPTITEEQISNSTQDGIHIPALSNTPLGH